MNKVFYPIFTIAFLLSCSTFALASPAPDVVLSAMQDEMNRSMKRLKLNEHNGPYFISYRINQDDNLSLSASCGALTEDSESNRRTLKVDVKEGDYHLDSSNFNISIANILAALNNNIGRPIPIDNNYDALRHTLWLDTDEAYKAAVKTFEAKKNFLNQNNVRERPDDFSQEKPTILTEKSIKSDIDSARWQAITKSTSAIFRQYPEIQHSLVTFTAHKVTSWFTNSEGSSIRQNENQYSLIVMASLQASDGMQLADRRIFCANYKNDLPKEEELNNAIKEMIEKLIALKSAPLAHEYRGPILLEGQSAAEFINQLLRHNLGHANETLSASENSPLIKHNPMKDLVGQSIFPPFISIIDDPLSEKFHNYPIVGGYTIDDDGIPAQKIVLVDKGVLKTFCTSRTPTLYTKNSNGHSVNGVGEASILYINSDNQIDSKALKDKLIELGKKAGLKSVMIVRWLSTYDAGLFSPSPLLMSEARNSGAGSLFVRSPLLLYSVCVDDGREELLRGALFNALSMRVLRDIVCTGNDAKPWFTLSIEPGDVAYSYYHLVTPSLLIGEIELHQPGKETDKLPILSNPLAEKL